MEYAQRVLTELKNVVSKSELKFHMIYGKNLHDRSKT